MRFKKSYIYYGEILYYKKISSFIIHIVSLLFIELYQYFNTNIDSQQKLSCSTYANTKEMEFNYSKNGVDVLNMISTGSWRALKPD